MSAVQSAVIAHRNGDADKFLDDTIDANGDPVNNGSVLASTSSSEEDNASWSSNNDEKDDVIQLKTR